MDPRTSAQDVLRCDLCETAVVQMHCDTCLVNLCKACVGDHFTAALSKSHKIVDFKNRKSTPLYPGCLTHNNERCKMYCKQCDIPLCTKCIATDEHLGHKVSEILQVLDEKRISIILEQTELNDTIYPIYQDIASDVQNRMSQLGKEYGDLSTVITKHGEDWHREIDKLVKKLQSEVDELKNTQLQTLQKHLDEINKNISDIKDEINSLENAVGSKDISKLFSVKSSVEEYRRIPLQIVPSLPKFTPKRIDGEFLKIKKKSPEAESSPLFKQLLDETHIITTTDTGFEDYLYNVACLSDEEIWTRGYDSIVKLFSINQGSQLKAIRTKSGNRPPHMAVTKSGDLVFTNYSDQTVNIVKNEKIEEVIRLQNWIPRNVCSTLSGDLLVILNNERMGAKVVRYYMVPQAVVVVNKAGKLRFRYTGHIPAPQNKPFYPRGITTDSQSYILTADYNNYCVHIIDQDGQFLRYINCGLSAPWGLCTDENYNQKFLILEKHQANRFETTVEANNITIDILVQYLETVKLVGIKKFELRELSKGGDLVYTDYWDRTVNIVKNENIEKFDDKGKCLYACHQNYLTEKKDLDICVSDCKAKAVVVAKQARKLIFRYTGHTSAPQNQPSSPQGITTDSQSHILTADINNYRVHIIDQDGQFLCYIDCGVSDQQGLCIDMTICLLFNIIVVN
ncbi:uncharacterized protein LOC133178132 [Saccostrea echinata]|uniref:uncharacterized protein LOC133178132 n=1 Tax=Saccostrea echinata TaxID=191078 RepID=UPI002A826FFD|nr:uncharacterized protein LOC133178132 [Saccostrea echinata]